MYFRTGSNVADLSPDKDFDRFFRLPHVLLEWQRGKIEDDGIKTGPGRFNGLRQRMGMIRVEIDWVARIPPANSAPEPRFAGLR
jgi:hypothetical protein